MVDIKDYYGRLVTRLQLPVGSEELFMPLESFTLKEGRLSCQRCAKAVDREHCLPNGDYYCRFCLVFGRNQSSIPLYYLPQQPFAPSSPLRWQGTLTPYQESVSKCLLSALEKRENVLVHAVTGAGKTEMIYQTVAKVLEEGGSVALVSPRIDVCNELFQRFRRDFSCPIALLHGETDAYHRVPLVIATVHQLFKFYQAFDLIIVDEVDAFPYVDNPQLYHAVTNALKPDGLHYYLTATSTDHLNKAVRSGQLKVAHLARRFHGNPLVIPKPIWLSGLIEKLNKKELPAKLVRYIATQRQTGYPLLLFFPHIALGKTFTELLNIYFPTETVAFVSSQSDDRLAIVEGFRNQDVTILVSTTILERGVTFPSVDVFVLWANHPLYNSSSLVQISGRVGRSLDRPTGELLFFHDGQTRAMKKAIAEIKEMNGKGGFNDLSIMPQ